MPPLPLGGGLTTSSTKRWDEHCKYSSAIGLFLPVIRVRSTIDTTASKYRPNAVEAAVVGAVHR
jgi:hypothetical protein